MQFMADIGIALCLAILPVEFASAQIPPPEFDSRTVESATTISDGVCSNPTIGISWQLPEGMKPEDAAAMREVARAGSAVGPEARYFLYGYNESKTIAMLCGAADEGGQVMMIATPLSAVQSEGPHALQKIVEGMVQELGTPPSSPRQETINGHSFERADTQAELNSETQGKVKLWESSFAAQVNSYVVTWSLVGYSEAEWKHLVAGMNTVKIFTPLPAALSAGPGARAPSSRPGPIAADFQARIADFLAAWLADRDQTKTLAFLDPAAYAAPPLIGTYCDGWYQKGDSPQRAAQTVSQNLMGVPAEFPKNTPPSAIFKAWDHLPPPWVSAAANDVTADHFLIAKLDSDSLARIFSGVFARSDYHIFLQSEIQKGGSAYWAVFPELSPDGDIFVIFTLWQKGSKTWNITHIDVVCQ
jgi:hypothetical protein